MGSPWVALSTGSSFTYAQSPCPNSIRLLRVPPNLTMNVSKDGTSTTLQGNLCQCFTILTAKNFLLISNLNQPTLQPCLLQPFHSTTGLQRHCPLSLGRKTVLCPGSPHHHYSQEHKYWGPGQLLHSSVPQENCCSVEPQLPQNCQPSHPC